MLSLLNTIWTVLRTTFRKRATLKYPEERPAIPPRWRGRIILSRDPEGKERCVACNLCAVACPVGCITLQAAEDEKGRRYPSFFRINFSRCIFCGFCEEACPTYAIQLTPDFEMSEYYRPNLVYEKEDLLISGVGKYPNYNFWRHSGVAIAGKDKGQAVDESAPVDVKMDVPTTITRDSGSTSPVPCAATRPVIVPPCARAAPLTSVRSAEAARRARNDARA